MTQTLFFDLDGTLTDPFDGITGSIRYALERLGETAPEPRDLAWCIGPPLLETFDELVGPERAPAAVTYYRERFGRVGLFENVPYTGIHATLETLRGSGRRLCVASSKPRVYVERILDRFELTPLFDAIFGSELDGTRCQKSDLLRFALAETGCSVEAATMIGDREHDILGARDNGVAHVAVLYGYGSRDELRAAGADRFARSPEDLVGLLG